VTGQKNGEAAFVEDGLREIRGMEEELLTLITKITEIPAPSNDEWERGAFVKEVMESYGFPVVLVDAVGNVLGLLPGKDPSKTIVSMAHLDTVFPRGTDLTVKREGNTLHAPGVSDNSASVAQMLLLGKLWTKRLPLPHPVLLVANVGEEGLGDLRGARYFCDHVADYDLDGFKLDPANLVFVNIDGGLDYIVNAGVGSRRLKITFSGEGGHSWGAFGKSSAIHGMGTAIAGIAKIEVPADPKTTYNVGVVSGGHSVNSIAQSAEMLLDMRSVSGAELAKLEREVRAVLDSAAAETNTSYTAQVVGDRPTGSLSADSPLVQGLVKLGAENGLKLLLEASSTDSNIPLSKGWPAVTVGFKRSENAHRVTEYLYIDSLIPGLEYAWKVYSALLFDRF
jgi:tripeptide aminopeptidase